MAEPAISVVIPTHNRSSSLLRLLVSLEKQTVQPERFEVIVVADACSDNTSSLVRRYSPAYAVECRELGSRSAAAARNRGARVCKAPLVLFLDDDLEATPRLIESHLRAHEECSAKGVVLGPYYPVHLPGGSLFRLALRNWWEDQFLRMSERGHRFTWRDVLSGNLSAPTDLFNEVGGFNTSFPACGTEDWELGIRLISRNIPIRFSRDAIACHYEFESMNLLRSFTRARIEGGGIARIGSIHPSFRHNHLREAVISRRGAKRLLKNLARSWGLPGEILARSLTPLLLPLDKFRFRRVWRHFYGAIRLFWFWRGYYSELKKQDGESLPLHQEERERHKTVKIDLAGGFADSIAQIERAEAGTVHCEYNGRFIGRIPPEWGAEPLSGRHLCGELRGALGKNLAREILKSENFSNHTRP